VKRRFRSTLTSTIRLTLCGVVAATLAACGFEPMPVPDASGMKPGPGLLSGKDGEFVIFRPR
jgi:hypothetical protein